MVNGREVIAPSYRGNSYSHHKYIDLLIIQYKKWLLTSLSKAEQLTQYLSVKGNGYVLLDSLSKDSSFNIEEEIFPKMEIILEMYQRSWMLLQQIEYENILSQKDEYLEGLKDLFDKVRHLLTERMEENFITSRSIVTGYIQRMIGSIQHSYPCFNEQPNSQVKLSIAYVL